MLPIRDYFKFGISVALLYPEAFQSPQRHLAAFSKTAHFEEYETLETFLPADESVRKTEIAIMKDEGKAINYNLPVDFQLDGIYNPGSQNPQYRKNALDSAKKHVDYAAEAGSRLVALTSGLDRPAERSEVLRYCFEYMDALSEHAQQYGITLTLEPAEREVFKNLVLGPTSETVAFISALQKAGRTNVKILLDTAHIPLMKEDQIDAIKISLEAGIGHVHLGNAVIRNRNSKYYGHIHPPIGIHDGEYDVDDVSDFLYHLLECGYISRTPGRELSTISLEMVPYPGVSPETSARVAYEKIRSALQLALSR
jgi:sugar phosphate isomerase/epimerase